ncbi:hypothetical protein BSLG_001986 [Batrachochytrium salamandrivorans]|nr:hypothetical protein BSLG_001986 [Batrachochytrium salamandrivorans]
MLQESIYAFPSSTALSEALDTLIERLSAQAISQRRCVPLADPESNYGASKTTLLDAIPVPAAQVMTLSEALAHTPEAAAADYQTKLMDAVKDKPLLVHNVIFVATGESKANVLHRMVDLNEDFPSARDTAAASQLSVPAKLFKL